MVHIKIKSKEEFDRKVSELSWLACKCRPHNREQKIKYEELRHEVTEYNEYAKTHINSLFGEHTQTMEAT